MPYALIQRRSARSPTCSARTRLIALSMLPTSEWRRASAAWQPNGDLFGWRGLSFLTTAARRPGCVRARHAWLSPHERVAHALAGRVRPISYVRIRGPPAARLCAVNVTELAPSTRYGDCRAQYMFVFFIGQALGPVVYGFDLRSAGITPALLAGALVLSIVPSLDERSLVAPTVGRDALVRHPDVFWQPSRMPKHVYRYAAARVPVTANTKPFRLDQFE